MKYGELTLGQIEAIVNKLGGMDGVRRLLSGGQVTMAGFYAIVNRDLSLAEAISAGHYDWVNPDIVGAKWTPSLGSGSKEARYEVLHFGRNIESDDAEAEIKRDERGLHSADLTETLAFGAKFPEEQRKYPVVGLGSVAEVGGGRRVACLRRGGSERYLDLGGRGGRWGGSCRFLAVYNN